MGAWSWMEQVGMSATSPPPPISRYSRYKYVLSDLEVQEFSELKHRLTFGFEISGHPGVVSLIG